MGLSMDERAMPREVVRVGACPLRKRQTTWKQPLAEAAPRCEPLINSAETRLHCGSRRTKSLNVPHWMTWNSASTQGYDWTSLWCNGICASINDDGTAGARCLVHLDEHGQHAKHRLSGRERSCTMLVATSFTTPVVKQG